MPSASRRTAARPGPNPQPETTPAVPPELPRFGAHMSIAGGHDRAVWAAHAVGFTTVQVFTKNNNR